MTSNDLIIEVADAFHEVAKSVNDVVGRGFQWPALRV